MCTVYKRKIFAVALPLLKMFIESVIILEELRLYALYSCNLCRLNELCFFVNTTMWKSGIFLLQMLRYWSRLSLLWLTTTKIVNVKKTHTKYLIFISFIYVRIQVCSIHVHAPTIIPVQFLYFMYWIFVTVDCMQWWYIFCYTCAPHWCTVSEPL